MSLSAGKGIFLQRLGDGSYNIYVALKLPEDSSKTETERLRSPQFIDELLTNDFHDWSPYITDMVKHCDGFSRVWPFYVIPRDSFPWTSVPGVTLIGDAAHLCPPSGEGANCAMYDSLQLAEEIDNCGVDHIDEAVKRFEEKMFSRAKELLDESEEIVQMFFDQNAPAGFKKWLASGMGRN
jgi:2-polyprenyl-6-methoxyphenol hydroxylase-like FAD-dependent oxidoreductase